MSAYNSKYHHRRSIRLKGYDYSQAGLYFVTKCVQNRDCLFGNISDGIMQLNDAGKMIEKWYFELENKFPDIKCGEHIIMPNHFHCIIHNVGAVGADLRVCPDELNTRIPAMDEKQSTFLDEKSSTFLDEKSSVELDEKSSTFLDEKSSVILGEHSSMILGEHSSTILGEHIGSPLHRVMQWFSTMSTNEYIRNVKSNNRDRFDGKLWQRNYWEHIIRNEKSHQRISKYIINNPKNWDDDKFKK